MDNQVPAEPRDPINEKKSLLCNYLDNCSLLPVRETTDSLRRRSLIFSVVINYSAVEKQISTGMSAGLPLFDRKRERERTLDTKPRDYNKRM